MQQKKIPIKRFFFANYALQFLKAYYIFLVELRLHSMSISVKYEIKNDGHIQYCKQEATLTTTLFIIISFFGFRKVKYLLMSNTTKWSKWQAHFFPKNFAQHITFFDLFTKDSYENSFLSLQNEIISIADLFNTLR